MQPSFGQILASYVATYGAPLLGYVVLRVLSVSLTLQMMMRRTPDVTDPAPVTAAEESAGFPAPEDLTFFELDAAKGILLNDPYESRLERALHTGSRTWSILWQSFFAYAFSAAVVLLGFLSYRGQVSDSQLTLGVFFAGLLILGLILLSVAGSHYRSIRRVPFATPLVCLLIMTAVSVVGGTVLELPFYLYLLPILWPAIVAIQGYGPIRRATREEGNLRLLILRVFGSDRNTSFVFGPLMRSWQFLGSFFTVVDPSYIRYQSSLSSGETRWKLLRLFFLYGAFIATLSLGASAVIRFFSPTNPKLGALQSLSRMQQQELIGMLAWLVLIPLAVLPVFFVVKNRFIRNLTALERRVSAAGSQTGGWSGVFKGSPLYCYDNVWKRAVNALLGASDVVLMDLRGFSPARAGCEYEVGVLIDQYPIQKIIFLVDQAETKKDVHELIRRRWWAMSAGSPNRGLKAPIVRTYAPGDEDKRDVPRILALLAASVDKGDGGGNAMVSFAGAQPRRADGWIPAESKSTLRRLPGRVLESLDMAVSNPRAAAAVLPVMLLAVLGLLFWRMRPLIRSFRAVATPKVVSVAEVAKSAMVTKDTPLSAAGIRPEARAIISSEGGSINGRTYSNPIAVSVDLTGGAAADAYRYGNVRITATDAAGASLEELKDGFGDSSESRFTILDHAATDFFTNQPEHPTDGLRLKLRFFQPRPATTQIRKLAGNVTLQLLDPAKMVQIDNIGAQLSIPGNVQLNHPRLAVLGKVSLVVYDFDRDNVRVVIESRSEDLSVRLVDATGIAHDSHGKSMENDSTAFLFPIKDSALAQGRLEIMWGYRTVEVPFELKNIEITKPAD